MGLLNGINFEFVTLQEHLTLMSGEMINQFIEKHCSNFAVDINDEFSYYSLPIPNNHDQRMDFLKVHKRIEIHNHEHKSYFFDVYGLYRSTTMCEDQPEVAVKLKYGHYVMDYYQAFIDMGHADFASALMQQYKLATASTVESTEQKSSISHNIKFLKEFAKENQQFKNINNYDAYDNKLKQYCDLDFSVYYIDENTLNIACSASAIIYSCVFDDLGGYKIYAQHNDYGMTMEALNDPSYDRYENENDCYDRLLAKYLYRDEFVVFECVDNKLHAYDLMVNSLLNITDFIVKEEESKLKVH